MTNPWVEWKTTWLNENSTVYIISKVWMKKHMVDEKLDCFKWKTQWFRWDTQWFRWKTQWFRWITTWFENELKFDWKPPLNDKHHGLNEMLHVLSKISMIKLKTPWLNENFLVSIKIFNGLNKKNVFYTVSGWPQLFWTHPYKNPYIFRRKLF